MKNPSTAVRIYYNIYDSGEVSKVGFGSSSGSNFSSLGLVWVTNLQILLGLGKVALKFYLYTHTLQSGDSEHTRATERAAAR